MSCRIAGICVGAALYVMTYFALGFLGRDFLKAIRSVLLHVASLSEPLLDRGYPWLPFRSDTINQVSLPAIAYHGVGEFVEVEDLTAERLSDLIQRVQANPSYRDRARYFQRVIARTHGLDWAADVIERAFKKNQIGDSARHPAAPSHM